MPEARRIQIRCADGFELGATLFEPETPNRRLALIGAALGVPSRFYADYAAFLAAQGYTVLTWDWRGMGYSRPKRLEGFEATLTGWATVDLPAVMDWAQNRFDYPVTGIGHSFGAQAYGLADRDDRFEKLLFIAAPTGHWGLFPAPSRQILRALVPLMRIMTRLKGYFPAGYFGMGDDVPMGAGLEWFEWCNRPEYLGNWEGHGRIRVPIRSIAFSDDRYGPSAACRWLLDRYGSPDKELEVIDPAAHGIEAIGHMGYFRRRVAGSIWHLPLPWLLRREG
ncbi:MAG: alpha/beta fold hydrolase [Gammaproteobacteria bacterium]|nr:alpha/beta fold hydrolase [Gammaproteobacteria bacterium]MDH4256487.1 alpha/beta fold hydrolase [Gammaproteobacteria bacterium]MDH5311882.1 alpha/beta fold hydrolase [Gammaproteobacteria bacterium]